MRLSRVCMCVCVADGLWWYEVTIPEKMDFKLAIKASRYSVCGKLHFFSIFQAVVYVVGLGRVHRNMSTYKRQFRATTLVAAISGDADIVTNTYSCVLSISACATLYTLDT